MQLIYKNMTSLFEEFTHGVLTGQGANSEILLRQVYRGLNDDFLTLIQDGEAVKKIAQVIQEKQGAVDPNNPDAANVSDTTKKVVLNTLTPTNCDPS